MALTLRWPTFCHFVTKNLNLRIFIVTKQGASATVTPTGVASRRKLTRKMGRRAEAFAPDVVITQQEATASTVKTVTIETATTTSAIRGHASVRQNLNIFITIF